MKQVYNISIEMKEEKEDLSQEIEKALCHIDVFGLNENIESINVYLSGIIK